MLHLTIFLGGIRTSDSGERTVFCISAGIVIFNRLQDHSDAELSSFGVRLFSGFSSASFRGSINLNFSGTLLTVSLSLLSEVVIEDV